MTLDSIRNSCDVFLSKIWAADQRQGRHAGEAAGGRHGGHLLSTDENLTGHVMLEVLTEFHNVNFFTQIKI